MAPPALGPEIYGLGFRFNPTPQEAVTYYLPRLVSGDPWALDEVVRPVIHHAEVYACDPADLAHRFRPMPRTDDRFFFASYKKAAIYDADRGSWNGQNTVEIKDDKGVQVGELKKLRYKKRGGFTDWLMEEYSSSCGVGGGGKQFVLCKMYVSPRAPPNYAAHRESAAFFALPPPPPVAPTFVIAQPAAKRPAPSQAAMPPYPKRVRGAVVHSALPPPQPPAPPVRKLSLAPPQPCARRRGLSAASVTRPSPAPIQAPALPVPTRPSVEARRLPMPAPPRPLAQPKEQVPLPTPQVVRACHMSRQAMAPPCRPQVFVQSKQRRILDPFETTVPRDEAEEQTVPAAPHQPPPPAAAPVLQNDDDDLVKALEDAMSTAEAEEQTVAADIQDEDEDGWDELDKEIEDAMRTAEADEQTVTAAPAKLQDVDDDDDDLAKVMEDMLSAEAEEPTVAALEFDVGAFFNFSEETQVCLPQANHAIKV